MPFLTSLSLLSRERFFGSSERECEVAKKDFKEWCAKFSLRLKTPESRYASIFADWWDTYTKDFFRTSAEEISQKLFGDDPKKTLALKSREMAQGDWDGHG